MGLEDAITLSPRYGRRDSTRLEGLSLVELVQIFLQINHVKILDEIVARLFSNTSRTFNNTVTINRADIFLYRDSLLVSNERIDFLPADHQSAIEHLRQRFLQEIESRLGFCRIRSIAV